MKLKNHTNIPTDTIRAIIRAVCPSNVSNFEIEVGNRVGQRRGGRGVAYTQGTGFRGTAAWPVVRVSIAKTEALARTIWRAGRRNGKGYLDVGPVGSRIELLVMIIAHELRHCWQAKVPRGWRVWGSRGVYSERDADAYAMRMLRAFRRGEFDLKPVASPVLPEKPKAPRAPWMLRAEREARALAQGMGIELRGYGFDVDAPAGYTFTGTETHFLVGSSFENAREYWESIRDDLLTGLTGCPPDCDCQEAA